MTRIVFLDPAEKEMLSAALYYESQATGLGEYFIAEVHRATQYIEENPESGMVIRGNIRRRLMRSFPFGILYRIESDEIVIVAVMHLRKRPGYWADRT